MKSVLITGGAGFIGSFLSRSLLSKGYDVVAVDNFSDYYARRAKEFNVGLVNEFLGNSVEQDEIDVKNISKLLEGYSPSKRTNLGKFNFYEVDIRDVEGMSDIFAKHQIDGVIHLAAMAGVPYSIKCPVLYSDVNLTGTVNLLELASKNNVKKFVFGSSSSVYGDTNKVPFAEDDNVDNPISPYAATKRMGEIMCYTYHHLYKFSIVSARIFGPIYGPLQRPYGMAAQKFIRQVDQGLPITIYGDGSMARDCTYIDDEVSGIIASLEVDTGGYEVINVGSGNPITVKYMADKIMEYMGRGEIVYMDAPPTEVKITYADTKKAKSLLGFESRVGFDEGVKRQIEVYEAMPRWYKEMKI